MPRTSKDDQVTRDLTDVKPGEPTSPDEAGDVSIANADNATLVREDNNNTSSTSGLRPGDEAEGETVKDHLKKGRRLVSRMD